MCNVHVIQGLGFRASAPPAEPSQDVANSCMGAPSHLQMHR